MYLYHWIESRGIKGYVIEETRSLYEQSELVYLMLRPWHHWAYNWDTDRTMNIRAEFDCNIQILPEEESAMLALQFFSFI